MKVGIKKQIGSFSVEAAFSFLLLSAVTLFLIDLSAQAMVKSQAERASYSLVNLLKERTRFFDGRYELSSQDVNAIYSVMERQFYLPLDNKQKGVGLVVESLIDGEGQLFKRGYRCDAQKPIKTLTNLVPVNSDNESFPIYQVTVCIEMDGVFSLVSGLRVISSSSVIPGR